jgi:hypothetical protein
VQTLVVFRFPFILGKSLWGQWKACEIFQSIHSVLLRDSRSSHWAICVLYVWRPYSICPRLMHIHLYSVETATSKVRLAESPYLFTPPSLALDRCAFAHKSLARLNSAYAGAYKHKTRGP